jgi:predicted DNA-binding transcriptional regulator AlpA
MKTLISLPELLRRRSTSRSTQKNHERNGLFIKPVATGLRSRAYPEDEVDALIAATIRGDGPDKIRDLVRSFHAARPDSLPSWNPNLNPRLVEARADFYDDVRAGRKKAPRFKGTFVPTDHGDAPADKGM